MLLHCISLYGFKYTQIIQVLRFFLSLQFVKVERLSRIYKKLVLLLALLLSSPSVALRVWKLQNNHFQRRKFMSNGLNLAPASSSLSPKNPIFCRFVLTLFLFSLILNLFFGHGYKKKKYYARDLTRMK